MIFFHTEPILSRGKVYHASMCETTAGVTLKTLVKAWLDSLNERPEGGWRNPVSLSLMGRDRLGARCLWPCREYGEGSLCSMLQDLKKLGTVKPVLFLAQCACVQPRLSCSLLSPQFQPQSQSKTSNIAVIFLWLFLSPLYFYNNKDVSWYDIILTSL